MRWLLLFFGLSVSCGVSSAQDPVLNEILKQMTGLHQKTDVRLKSAESRLSSVEERVAAIERNLASKSPVPPTSYAASPAIKRVPYRPPVRLWSASSNGWSIGGWLSHNPAAGSLTDPYGYPSSPESDHDHSDYDRAASSLRTYDSYPASQKRSP